jgi:hypothetical protein
MQIFRNVLFLVNLPSTYLLVALYNFVPALFYYIVPATVLLVCISVCSTIPSIVSALYMSNLAAIFGPERGGVSWVGVIATRRRGRVSL